MSLEQTLENAPDWLHRVVSGDFTAVPARFAWAEAHAFAHLINGYAASLGTGRGELAQWANRRAKAAGFEGSWRGSAFELWCCLFYEMRRWRHFGDEPTGNDLVPLDRLCERLREALQTIDDDERLQLLEWFRLSHPAG